MQLYFSVSLPMEFLRFHFYMLIYMNDEGVFISVLRVRIFYLPIYIYRLLLRLQTKERLKKKRAAQEEEEKAHSPRVSRNERI